MSELKKDTVAENTAEVKTKTLLCTKKYRRQGALVLMGLLAGLLVGNVALKHLVARSRPCWLDPSVQLLIATPTDYSFPSGHTLSSTIAATILAHLLTNLDSLTIALNSAIETLRPFDRKIERCYDCMEHF